MDVNFYLGKIHVTVPSLLELHIQVFLHQHPKRKQKISSNNLNYENKRYKRRENAKEPEWLPKWRNRRDG